MESGLGELLGFRLSAWPYAPSNLRHLKQPVPKDLPPSNDSTIFTFEDAFEDLLAVSQGNALPDINIKYSQRQLLRQMFPNGEPTWFWLRRLHSQGLLSSNRRDEYRGIMNPGLLSDDLEDAFPWSDWSRLHQELDRQSSQVWRKPNKDLEGKRNPDSDDGDFLDEIHKTFDQVADSFNRRSASNSDDEPVPGNHHQKRLPDHFDDLFSGINSSFDEGQKSWDTFLKTIRDSKSAPREKLIQQDPNKTSEERVDEHGNKEVVTTDEYVDRLGFLHSTVTRKTYDRDGNQIGSQSHFTLRSGGKDRRSQGNNDAHVIDRTQSDADNQQTDTGKDNQQNEDKKVGWFWK